MKKLLIAIVCIALTAAAGKYGYDRFQKKKDSKRVVDVVPISLLSQEYWADETTLDATVTSGNSQNVYLDSEKLVKELNVSVGDKVKKGDVILTYDMTVVELEIEQKKNRIAVLEQQINEQQRELDRINSLLPSELAPQEPQEPEEPYFPEPEPEPEPEPDTPDEPDITEPEAPPIKLIDKLSDLGQADGMNDDGALIFRCTPETEVSPAFMGMLKTNGKRALIYAYDETETVAYFWDIQGKDLSEKLIEKWTVGDGVAFENGSAYFDNEAAKPHGIFKGYDPEVPAEVPDEDMPDEDLPEEDLPEEDFPDEDFPEYDIPDDTYWEDENTGEDTQPEQDELDENYMYSRNELAQMAREQETEIKQLKIDLKSATLDYNTSLDQKQSGSVTAEIDGIVVKVGSAANDQDYTEDTEGLTDGDYFIDDGGDLAGDEAAGELTDGELSDAEAGSAYVVIQGEEGVCIDINVGELNLDKFAPGTVVSGMSYDTGEMFSATVLSVSEEPQSYYSYMWNENPDSSTYIVTASVDPGVSLTVGSWVSVTMPQSEQADSGLYIPIHYTRKDGASYYVMKADKKGKLKKQYLNTGKIVWGSYVEVKGGIKLDDMICFPYGKDVKEGVKTKESDKVLY